MSARKFPALGVKYPLKIGKSLKERTGLSRSVLAMKFTQIPEKAQLHKPATLCRQNEKCHIEIPTQDGSVQFSGQRTTPKPESAINDYVLVLVDGVMFLERMSDYFIGLRPVDTRRPPLQYPPSPEDDPMRDPDSWMPGARASGSPITPEDDAAMTDEIPPVPTPRIGGKSTSVPAPPASKRKLVVAGRVNTKPHAPPNGASSVARKSVAGKGMAGKGISPSTAPGRRRPDDDDEEDDANDGSSSDDDDSDDSDSDSSDSDDYTDRSSDED